MQATTPRSCDDLISYTLYLYWPASCSQALFEVSNPQARRPGCTDKQQINDESETEREPKREVKRKEESNVCRVLQYNLFHAERMLLTNKETTGILCSAKTCRFDHFHHDRRRHSALLADGAIRTMSYIFKDQMIQG